MRHGSDFERQAVARPEVEDWPTCPKRNPSKPAPPTPTAASCGYPALTFRRRTGTGAPTYLVEASENLSTWTGNTEGQPPVTVEVGSPVVHGDGFETVTVRHVLPVSAAAKRYLRVKVSQP